MVRLVNHLVTTYEMKARRKNKPNDPSLLVLTALGATGALDLLDVLEAHWVGTESVKSADSTRSTSINSIRRDGDFLHAVVNIDVVGESSAVRDPSLGPEDQLVFIKRPNHVTRYLALASVWRTPGGNRGLVAVHSPWGRASRTAPLVLMQRALNLGEAKAKMLTDMLIPPRALTEVIATATGVMKFKRGSTISSTFTDEDEPDPAEATVTQIGDAETTVRVGGFVGKKLLQVFQRKVARQATLGELLTVEVDLGTEEGLQETQFDDLDIEVETPVGPKFFSIRDGKLPSFGFNVSPELNAAYAAFSGEDDAGWPAILLEEGHAALRKQLELCADML